MRNELQSCWIGTELRNERGQRTTAWLGPWVSSRWGGFMSSFQEEDAVHGNDARARWNLLPVGKGLANGGVAHASDSDRATGFGRFGGGGQSQECYYWDTLGGWTAVGWTGLNIWTRCSFINTVVHILLCSAWCDQHLHHQMQNDHQVKSILSYTFPFNATKPVSSWEILPQRFPVSLNKRSYIRLI